MKVKKNPFLLSVVLAAFMFQDALAARITIFMYMDEVIAIFSFLYMLLLVVKKKMHSTGLRILTIMTLLCVIGFWGNCKSDLDIQIIYMLFDAFNIFKYIFVILGASAYFRKYKWKKELIHYMSNIVDLTVLISTFFMVLNLVTDIGMYTDYRFGLRAYNFIFSRVGGMYSACIIWLLITTAELYYTENAKSKLMIVLILINMCATLRSRAFAFALLYGMIYYAFFVMKKKQFKWWYLVPFALLAFLIANEQLMYYFSGERARNVLLKYGIVTAKQYFPFGAGFATYGTAIARDIYSGLYDSYGFSNFWGLSRSFGDLLTDNFWPAILGEFGIVGTIITVSLIWRLTKLLYRQADNNHSRSMVIFAMGTLIISSVASSAFFSCSQLMLFLCIVLTLTETKESKNKNLFASNRMEG